MNKNELFVIREGVQDDKNLVYASFLRGVFYGDTMYSDVSKDIFMSSYHEILDSMMSSDNIKVKVACLKDDHTVILGYSILSAAETTLHWVFTKKAWRNIGLSKCLVPDTIKAVTHLTETGKALLKRHPEVTFNPFLLGEFYAR